jgi:hypothetical protein
VIWPLLKQTRAVAVAMEPGGDEFKRISQAAGGAVEAAQATNAAGTAFLDRVEATIEGTLKAHWEEPADTQDGVTADLTRALAMLQSQIYGAAFVSLQSEWDNFMAARAVETIRANPGKRVLVLGSFRNRALLTQMIQRTLPARVADVEKYLRSGQLIAAPGAHSGTQPK